MNSKRRIDHSDDEGPHHSRDKFTRERRNKNNSSPEDRGNYDSPLNGTRVYILILLPKRRRSITPDQRRPLPDGGDHYVPNYDKDGYTPAPRYHGRASEVRFAPPGYPVMQMGFNVPNPQMLPPGAPIMPMDWAGPTGRQEPLKDPDQLDFLVTFKYFSDFMQYTNPKSRPGDEELHKKYNEYKEAFAVKQLKTFFEAHQKEEWFLEKYHPKYMEPRIAITKELKKKQYEQFISDLKEGLLDSINNDAKLDIKIESNEDSHRLFIKSVSPNIPRQKIEEMCKEIPGFKYLALSEPNPQKKFHRLGWIVFEEDTDMDSAYEKLNEKKNQSGPVRNRITPEIANTPERLKKDLISAQKLIEKLDNDVDSNTFDGSKLIKQRIGVFLKNEDPEEINTVKKTLDMYIEYLRRVHLFCYYCGSESDSIEELSRKCPGRHLRSLVGTDTKNPSKNTKDKQVNATQWQKTLENKIAYKTEPWKFEEEVEKQGGQSIQQVLDKFYQENVIEVDPGRKFKCNLCSKLFKGADFVKKHIDYKHNAKIDVTTNEIKFYNNYVLDPNHLLPTTPPNPTATLNVPQNVTPIPPNPFPVMTNAPPPPFMGFSFPTIVGAAAGTPHDQIPRIGFEIKDGNGQRGQRINDKRRQTNPGKQSADPRQVKSYVDLDAPAEGDIEIKY
ncbi:8356_t:CDS:10 [Entrophospora sp. SA101]|nr:8356_t:CDS:10 [Entrophospora sp. SA101]CAJ0826841.1 7147_t:CDS:10 [Entrophospora sp. SA101]